MVQAEEVHLPEQTGHLKVVSCLEREGWNPTATLSTFRLLARMAATPPHGTRHRYWRGSNTAACGNLSQFQSESEPTEMVAVLYSANAVSRLFHLVGPHLLLPTCTATESWGHDCAPSKGGVV